jgi:hypothetical protein
MSLRSPLSVNGDELVYKIAHHAKKNASPFRLLSCYLGTNRHLNRSHYVKYYIYWEIDMKQTIRNILFAGAAVLTLSLVPTIADARGGGHGGSGHGGGHVGGGHMGGHFAGGHYGHHGGRYAGGYRHRYGYGYGGDYCGPIQIAAGLCGGYGY